MSKKKNDHFAPKLIVVAWQSWFKIIFPHTFAAEKANAVEFHFLWMTCFSLADLEYFILDALKFYNDITKSGSLEIILLKIFKTCNWA